MADQLDDFLKDSQAMVGQPATDVSHGAEVADWISIRQFCAALGDANPLYKDPASGVATKYNSMIAPPAFVAAIRTPTSVAAYNSKDYGVANLFTHGSIEWVDVIRVGDRLESELAVTAVTDGLWNGRRAAQVTSEVTYRNSYGGLIGTSTGVSSIVPLRRGEEMITDREIYVYSDDEIARIERDIEGELPPRGQHLRYWSDAEIGEALPQLVKGPLNLSDMMAWTVGEQKPLALGPPVYFGLKSAPGRIRTNPSTNWPYSDVEQEYDDILSSRDLGFIMPVSRGMQRVCLASQVVTDWMGDDGFLRSLDVDLPGHYLYGDTMWLRGEATGKHEDVVSGQTYNAVTIQLIGTNQLGETVLRGTAIAYLPAPGHPVQLPIPH